MKELWDLADKIQRGEWTENQRHHDQRLLEIGANQERSDKERN
jgi:hypothetical protein